MATVTLTNGSFELRFAYTAKNGTLKITEIEGRRTDGYRSWDTSDTSLTVSVSGTSKSISLSHYIDFDTSWTEFGATDTSWTGLSGSSISITTTMPTSTTAYNGLKFSGTATMSWDTYTITYNANGGSGAPASQTKTYGTSLTLSSTKPTRTGYTFKNWNTESDGSGTTYNSGASYTSNSGTTLYAQWTANTLKVYYNANGSSIDSDTYYLSSNNIYNTSSNAKYYQSWTYNNAKDNGLVNASTFGIYKTGYTFAGWGTSSSGGTIFDQDDTSLVPTDLSSSISSGDATLTLYAQWEENVLTVNYYSNGADYCTIKGEVVSVGDNTKVYNNTYKYSTSYSNGLSNVQNPDYIYMTRIGYTPTHKWGTSTNGGNLVDEDTAYTGQALAVALGKSLENGDISINVYAQWQINTYIIAYNPNGGSGSMDSQTVEWNELFTFAKNTFVREGYKFIGWNLYRNDDDKWYAESQGWLTEDEILTNNYSKRLYIDQRELTLDESWIRGNEFETTEFTLYAIWEISGVVYIDNGVTLEPYLVYIDNGTDWDLHIAYVDNGLSWNLIS